MKALFFVFCLLGLTCTLKAQNGEEKVKLSGVVIDAQTLTPLPYANISRNDIQGTTTDENGRFTIKVNSDDTIEVTYVGYQKHVLNHQEKENNYLIVYMEPMVSMLQEIEVLFLPTEEEFKERIEALQPTKQHIHALNNISLTRLYAEAIAEPVDRPFLNHPYIGSPSDFTFFSSKGQQGITRFIRSTKIMHNQSTYFHLKPYEKPDESLVKESTTANLKDSSYIVRQDSLLSKKNLNNK